MTATPRPRVSVIMIFFNAERFIEEAIRSVLAQTVRDWELILVDDGSSDNSTAIALRYARDHSDRIYYTEHPDHNNLGMSRARNAGLEMARGDYVCFLDADDIYLPERLERHLAILDRHPEVGVVQSTLLYWHSWRGGGDEREPTVPVRRRAPIRPPTLFALMLQSDGATVPGICSVTLRRTALLALGGFEGVFRSTYEDQVMHAKVYLTQTAWVVDDCLARYRQHAESSLQAAMWASEYTPGRPHAARLQYLTWLEDYLRTQDIVHPLARSSLDAALWPYRHPWAHRFRDSPQAILRGARRVAQWILPVRLVAVLTRWRGRQKDAAARNRAERAAARIEACLDTPEEQDAAREGVALVTRQRSRGTTD